LLENQINQENQSILKSNNKNNFTFYCRALLFARFLSFKKHSFNSISSFSLIMSRFFKEHFEVSFFIVENNDSFAEIITSSMTMKALKKRCEELKARLQAREIISSSSIYSERSRSQKILDSSLFTDEKNSIWKNWYEKVQNKLEINVNLFSSEWVKLSYVHFRLFNDAAEIT